MKVRKLITEFHIDMMDKEVRSDVCVLERDDEGIPTSLILYPLGLTRSNNERYIQIDKECLAELKKNHEEMGIEWLSFDINHESMADGPKTIDQMVAYGRFKLSFDEKLGVIATDITLPEQTRNLIKDRKLSYWSPSFEAIEIKQKRGKPVYRPTRILNCALLSVTPGTTNQSPLIEAEKAVEESKSRRKRIGKLMRIKKAKSFREFKEKNEHILSEALTDEDTNVLMEALMAIGEQMQILVDETAAKVQGMEKSAEEKDKEIESLKAEKIKLLDEADHQKLDILVEKKRIRPAIAKRLKEMDHEHRQVMLEAYEEDDNDSGLSVALDDVTESEIPQSAFGTDNFGPMFIPESKLREMRAKNLNKLIKG